MNKINMFNYLATIRNHINNINPLPKANIWIRRNNSSAKQSYRPNPIPQILALLKSACAVAGGHAFMILNLIQGLVCGLIVWQFTRHWDVCFPKSNNNIENWHVPREIWIDNVIIREGYRGVAVSFFTLSISDIAARIELSPR